MMQWMSQADADHRCQLERNEQGLCSLRLLQGGQVVHDLKLPFHQVCKAVLAVLRSAQRA